MLVAGIIGMSLAVAFSFVINFLMTFFSTIHRGLLYAVSPSYRATVATTREAERARLERIEKYGNDDPVQYGDSRCAGYCGPGCHCCWNGTDRPPCY